MTTKTQEIARADLYAELKQLQSAFQRKWADGSLPLLWNEVPVLHPSRPNKTKVTILLDEDMLKWFRKMGRGYQAQINAVLRIYWQALLAGQIKSHWDADAVGPTPTSFMENLLQQRIEQLRALPDRDGKNAEFAVVEQELSKSLAMWQTLHQRP
jgi:uncharacterized protein (DUF4415 family)